MNKKVRSPFFYVGDKYKLMPQLEKMFPKEINTYFEPFLGGGSSVLYTKAKEYQLNDVDEYVIKLHKYILSFTDRPDELFSLLEETITKYGLSFSFLDLTIPEDLKKRYKKTYYAKYNKESYMKMRKNFNDSGQLHELYLLLIYGFNRMIRFNSKGEFNVPVGNVDFNKNVATALKNYLEYFNEKKVYLYNLDYKDFIKKISFKLKKDDFIYFDPPYLITNSQYNSIWNEKEEKNLYRLLDELDEKRAKFGISNIVNHKGKQNKILKNWMIKYNVFEVESNYISRFDNTIKRDSREVYITNYEQN
ncbi:TPA: DNA adenine methylase [Bacillus anthracis]